MPTGTVHAARRAHAISGCGKSTNDPAALPAATRTEKLAAGKRIAGPPRRSQRRHVDGLSSICLSSSRIFVASAAEEIDAIVGRNAQRYARDGAYHGCVVGSLKGRGHSRHRWADAPDDSRNRLYASKRRRSTPFGGRVSVTILSTSAAICVICGVELSAPSAAYSGRVRAQPSPASARRCCFGCHAARRRAR